eukprot:SAG11_NODE_2596_length_3183_cov_12.191310_5_plen_118_part_00
MEARQEAIKNEKKQGKRSELWQSQRDAASKAKCEQEQEGHATARVETCEQIEKTCVFLHRAAAQEYEHALLFLRKQAERCLATRCLATPSTPSRPQATNPKDSKEAATRTSQKKTSL